MTDYDSTAGMQALTCAWEELRRHIARDVLADAVSELEDNGNAEAANELRDLTDEIVWHPRNRLHENDTDAGGSK